MKEYFANLLLIWSEFLIKQTFQDGESKIAILLILWYFLRWQKLGKSKKTRFVHKKIISQLSWFKLDFLFLSIEICKKKTLVIFFSNCIPGFVFNFFLSFRFSFQFSFFVSTTSSSSESLRASSIWNNAQHICYKDIIILIKQSLSMRCNVKHIYRYNVLRKILNMGCSLPEN